MKRKFIISLLLFCAAVSAGAKDYDSLFSKEDARADGPVTLHKVGQKVYLELPDSLLGRSFLFGSVVEKCSNPLECHSGFVPAEPVEIVFSMEDSCIVAAVPSHFEISPEPYVRKAVARANIPAVVRTFKIVSRHGYASVFDISSFVTAKSVFNNPLSPDAFNASEGYVKRTGDYQSGSTVISGVRADSLSASVSSSYTFKVKSAFLGVFAADEKKLITAETAYWLRLLPENPLPAVKADRRAGYASYRRRCYNPDGSGSREEFITVRRRLDAPLVFTIDTNFPEAWAGAAEDAVRNWNEAFEKAGLGRPLASVRGESGENMIHYVISPVQKIFDRKICDPRSGEILASDIYINHGVQEKLQTMLMFQTSAANEKARKLNIDEGLMRDALCSVLMRRIGHCLGLRDNLIGSYTYSSEDIASADFSNAHGLSSAVMDRLPFNYLTDSPDALFIQTKTGTADVFALECLYKYGYDEVLKALKDNAGNAETTFMALQKPKAFYDPRAEYGDLGNDVLFSVSKGIEHLEYAVTNLDEWVAEEDKDLTFRSYMRNYILDQLLDYVRHGFEFIGGMYVHEPDASAETAAKVPVPRDEQRKYLREMLRLIDSLSWVDANCSCHELEGPYTDFIRKYFTNFIFIQLNGLSKCRNLGPDTYSQADAASDIMDYFWSRDKEESEFTRYQREMFIDQIYGLATNSEDPQIWYGILKETRRKVRRSGDRYLLHLVDKRIESI